jgi:hypothetical protein
VSNPAGCRWAGEQTSLDDGYGVFILLLENA